VSWCRLQETQIAPLRLGDFAFNSLPAIEQIRLSHGLAAPVPPEFNFNHERKVGARPLLVRKSATGTLIGLATFPVWRVYNRVN
jgi:hypothetical protein